MFYVYIIRIISSPHQVYTGFTKNLILRFKDHNSGKSPYTSKFKPWKLEAYFAFSEKKLAINFENYLKSPSGRAFRNKRLAVRMKLNNGYSKAGH